MADDRTRNNLAKEYRDALNAAKDSVKSIEEAMTKTSDIVSKMVEITEGQLDLFEDQEKVIGKINKDLSDSVKTSEKSFDGFKKTFGKITAGAGKVKSSFISLKAALLGGAGILGAIGLVGKAFVERVTAVDSATANLIKTTGILDSSLSKTLIEATEQSALLGGNIELAADAIKSLTDSLSPAISLSGKLVGNVANVAERFGLGADNAVRLTQIVSELTSATFEDASSNIESLIDGLGRLGPAVVRNLVESYDSVIDRFGISLQSLKQQTLQATQLGLSLSKVADVSEKLLDFQSSISSEFRASAILGQQINLQKARQLAFEGNIVGALNETLDRVEEIGDFEQLNFFQRKAIADTTGLSVSELQKELNLRRQLGVQGRIEAATRETALGKIEEINRRIQSALFKIFADPSVQRAFDNFADSIIRFLEGPQFTRIANSLGDAVEKLGDLLSAFVEGRVRFNPITGFKIKPDTTVNDAIITPQGQVIKTNPRDYIMATQNPQTLVSGGNDVMVSEMIGLLRDLKQNGVRAEVNLDGKKVSKQIALSNRY